MTGDDDKVLGGMAAGTLSTLFRNGRDGAHIENLRFHAARREALTRLSRVFNVMDLAKISGHRDLKILQHVYYSPTAADLADRLGNHFSASTQGK